MKPIPMCTPRFARLEPIQQGYYNETLLAFFNEIAHW